MGPPDVARMPTWNSAWDAVFGGGPAGLGGAGDPAADPADSVDVAAFSAAAGRRVPEWAQLFQRIPADDKRRKDALGGAVKVKAAGKRLEKLAAAPPAAQAAEAAEQRAAATAEASAVQGEATAAPGGAEGAGTRPSADTLSECQAAFREVVHGLLDVSFAADELVNKDGYADPAAVEESRRRLELAAELTAALGRLFAASGRDPRAAGDAAPESLPPEMLKMLERCMDENKGSKVANTAETKAARAAWERGEGLCSGVLGEELWEALCWRHGIFLFGYVGHAVKRREELLAAGAAEAPGVPRAVVADAIRSLGQMLHAQGPIPSDADDPAIWKANSDGQHEDETARMFYHGVHGSSHLRGLKFLAELCYWQWKHNGRSQADGELACVANRKFAHVVRHIIPGAGWTADVEADRVAEVGAALGTAAFSAGLEDKPAALCSLAAKGGRRAAAPAAAAIEGGAAAGAAAGTAGAAGAAAGEPGAGAGARKKKPSKKR